MKCFNVFILVGKRDLNLCAEVHFFLYKISYAMHVLIFFSDHYAHFNFSFIFSYMFIQIFVANPNKPRDVKIILGKNKGKLLELLHNLSPGKGYCAFS